MVGFQLGSRAVDGGFEVLKGFQKNMAPLELLVVFFFFVGGVKPYIGGGLNPTSDRVFYDFLSFYRFFFGAIVIFRCYF